MSSASPTVDGVLHFRNLLRNRTHVVCRIKFVPRPFFFATTFFATAIFFFFLIPHVIFIPHFFRASSLLKSFFSSVFVLTADTHPPAATLPSSTSEPPSTTSEPPTTTSEVPPSTTSSTTPLPVTPTPSTTSTTPGTSPTPSTTSTRAGGGGASTSTTPGPGSSTSTSVFSTVVVTTDPNGQIQTQTVQTTQLISPSQSQNSGGSSPSTSNTAAIAGGVVGGAVGLLAIIILVFFFLRRRKRKDDFDGNFDPDRLDPERFGGNAARPGAMPNVDLVGAEITPFQYPGGAQQHDQYPQMAQRPAMPTPVVGGSGIARSDLHSSTTGSHYPTTVTEQSVTGMQNMDFRNPSPGPSLGTTGTIPSSKERELASERRRLHIANDERGEGGSGQGSGGVVQHKDGGRVQQQSAPEEVPPSYDSISPDERDAAGRS